MQDFMTRRTSLQKDVLTRTGGDIYVYWNAYKSVTGYEQINLTNNTWYDFNATCALAVTEDGAQGTHYGSGAFGNDSGRSLTGTVILFGDFVTSTTAQTYYFTLGFWNGSSYVADSGIEQSTSIPAAATTAANGAQTKIFLWTGVTLANGDRFNFQVNRYTAAGNLRVCNMSGRFVEDQ